MQDVVLADNKASVSVADTAGWGSPVLAVDRVGLQAVLVFADNLSAVVVDTVADVVVDTRPADFVAHYPVDNVDAPAVPAHNDAVAVDALAVLDLDYLMAVVVAVVDTNSGRYTADYVVFLVAMVARS